MSWIDIILDIVKGIACVFMFVPFFKIMLRIFKWINK